MPETTAPQGPTAGAAPFGAPRHGAGSRGFSSRGGHGGPGAAAAPADGFRETVVTINRVAKVVKGGKRFSFAALVVVGDGVGSVGWGLGKARDVQASIRKGNAAARKSLIRFPLIQGTIPHETIAKFRSTKVWMKPATPGTGVIAGGGVRAILEAAGVKDILSKILGSSNPYNVIGATMECLGTLKTKDEIKKLRGR